jgi:GMP synthase (glutamine-hydrolysing)
MFDPAEFVEEAVAQIKDQARGRTIIGASGGVDSTVAAAIAHKAIPDLLHPQGHPGPAPPGVRGLGLHAQG